MKKSILFSAMAAAFAGLQLHADTTWIIQPVATAPKCMQLFTSRSVSKMARPIRTYYNAPKDKKCFRNLCFGNDAKFAYAGINERGLVVAFAGTDRTKDRPNKPKENQRLFDGNFVVGHLLHRCGSVKEAEAKLRQLARSGLIANSMNVYLADAKNAMIFEIAPRHYATCRLGLHFTVYSNRWKLPGMEDASSRKPQDLQGSLQEEWAVKEAIYKARGGMNGKLSVPGSFAISRLNAADVKVKGIDRGPSTKHSIDAYLFEIDPEYPGILSCVYASFGPPRQTVYLPIPLGAMDALPPEVVNPAWAKASIELHRKTPGNSPLSSDLAEFEKYLLQEFEDTRLQARQLLKEDKTEEARQLLRDLLRRLSAETLKFMQERTR
jgi:hypothetical protein